jgi:hypothetical protein
MIRNPHPSRELDRDTYWSLDEVSLMVIVKIRQNARVLSPDTDQCPNRGANCWEAEQPPIVFRECACATMAFPLSMITGKLTSGPTPSRKRAKNSSSNSNANWPRLPAALIDPTMRPTEWKTTNQPRNAPEQRTACLVARNSLGSA